MRILHSVPATRRQALTLIELIVVMMILIALAGLLVPMLPSMLTRAHTSTCSTNMAECCKAITTYQALYQSYPNNWDALTDGTTMINYLAGSGLNGWPPGQGNGAGNGEVTQITLTAAEALNLTGVGITSVQPMVATAGTTPGDQQAFDPTFNYYVSTLPTTGALPITTGSILAGLDPTNPANTATIARCISLNLPLTGHYVCLGIGTRVSMVGKTIQTAPVHFGDQPALNPEYGYERLVAIFKVSDTAVGTNFTQAQFVGTAPIHDTGVGSIPDELQNWYSLTNNGS